MGWNIKENSADHIAIASIDLEQPQQQAEYKEPNCSRESKTQKDIMYHLDGVSTCNQFQDVILKGLFRIVFRIKAPRGGPELNPIYKFNLSQNFFNFF